MVNESLKIIHDYIRVYICPEIVQFKMAATKIIYRLLWYQKIKRLQKLEVTDDPGPHL